MQREIFLMAVPEDVAEVRLEPAAYGRLAEITAPTLVLVGDLDLPEKVAEAAWLARTAAAGAARRHARRGPHAQHGKPGLV
jgi:pimeloyl-ACP methyl ester carboxylesterase